MSRLQPRAKAPATSNISSQSASASKEHTSKQEIHLPRQTANRHASTDPLSERATLLLIRRTLCSQLGDKGRNTPLPIDQLLPPLTSSNEVDLELYALIAIIIREFVQAWYSKITPDQFFVEEVVKIIAHVTRALEQRLRAVDLESLLFDELPELLEIHHQAYRASHNSLHPGPFQQDPRQTYHSLWPFPALSPVPPNGTENAEQLANEAAYRQLLVQGLLAVMLPTEDLENDCLTSLVGQIFSEMILGGGVGGKACEPWLLWEGISKIVEVIQAQLPNQKAQVRVQRSNSSLGALPINLTGGNTYRYRLGQSLQKTFWLVLQYGFLAFTTIRFFIITLTTASSLPSRITISKKGTGLSDLSDHMNTLSRNEASPRGQLPPLKQPIMKMKIWSCANSLLDVSVRMPWLSSTLSLLQWGAMTGPGEVGNTDGMVDKILSHAIQTKVLDPSLVPTVLRAARAALFPNNAPGPPRIVPSAPEQILIRRRCAEDILSLIPIRIQDVFFGAGVERRINEIAEVLDMFSDSYCNKHLLYGIVELVVVRLVPEMAEKGVQELLADRLS